MTKRINVAMTESMAQKIGDVAHEQRVKSDSLAIRAAIDLAMKDERAWKAQIAERAEAENG